jgi:hypothetical protein
VQVEGVSQFTEAERKELRRRARVGGKKKKAEPQVHVSAFGELRKDVAFQREADTRAGKFAAPKKTFSGFFPGTIIPRITTVRDPQEARLMQTETGLRGAEIIERGVQTAGTLLKDGTSRKLVPDPQAEGKFLIKDSSFTASLKEQQKVIIPSIKEVSSNPTALVATTGALAFQVGSISTLTSAPPKQQFVSVKTQPVGKITIASKGSEARFVAGQKFTATVKQPPPDVGFRVPKSIGGMGSDPTVVGRFTGTTITRGSVTGLGKTSKITSESFVTLRDAGGKVVYKDVLAQQSRGITTDTTFGQKVTTFNIKTGGVSNQAFELGGKVVKLEGKSLFIAQKGTTFGGKGFSTSASKISATQKGVQVAPGVTAQPTRNPIYKGTLRSTGFTSTPGAGLGKSGQLGGQRLFTSTFSPASRVVTPPKISLRSLAGAKSTTVGSGTRLGLASLTGLGSTISTRTRTGSQSLFKTNVSLRQTPQTLINTRVKLNTLPGVSSRINTRVETRLITHTTVPGITTPPFPTPTTPRIPPPPPGIIVLPSGGGGFNFSSPAATSLTGGKFGFVPSFAGQTLGIGATGGKLFSGLGIRTTKKRRRKK